MTLSGKLILVSVAAIVAAILILPALALLTFLGTLAGFFVVIAAVWACVLLGERWIDEGLGGYNYLDALGESFENLFQGLYRLFTAPRRPTLRERLVAFLPMLTIRARLVLNTLSLPLLVPYIIVQNGVEGMGRDVLDYPSDFARVWRTGRL